MDGSQSLRVLTYNVRHCRGSDDRVSPQRIARILASLKPDVVALQEVDMGRPRTNNEDQTRILASALGMHSFFQPNILDGTEAYGNAVLSKPPTELQRAESFPYGGLGEPRGAIWVTLYLGDRPLQLINTHLGYRPSEQRGQADALLRWLAEPACTTPRIVLGDFNAWPGSRTYRKFRDLLLDAQHATPFSSPRNTYPARMPLVRIDHVFHSADLRVVSARVPRTPLTCVASDHLPLVVEVTQT